MNRRYPVLEPPVAGQFVLLAVFLTDEHKTSEKKFCVTSSQLFDLDSALLRWVMVDRQALGIFAG